MSQPMVGAWSPWFWGQTAYRVLAIKDPKTGRTRWTGWRRLSSDAAQSWQADTLESNWGSEVDLYTWTGSSWRPGA